MRLPVPGRPQARVSAERQPDAVAPRGGGRVELDDRVRGGLAAQLARRQHEIDGGARRVGWKLGRDIAEVEALMGSKPVIGYLTTATMLASPAVHRADDAVALRAETELALTIGHDVGADTGATAARGAIAGLSVAL